MLRRWHEHQEDSGFSLLQEEKYNEESARRFDEYCNFVTMIGEEAAHAWFDELTEEHARREASALKRANILGVGIKDTLFFRNHPI